MKPMMKTLQQKSLAEDPVTTTRRAGGGYLRQGNRLLATNGNDLLSVVIYALGCRVGVECCMAVSVYPINPKPALVLPRPDMLNLYLVFR